MLDDAILGQAAVTLQLLRARGSTVVTAESCTGGLIAASLTHHSGSSDIVLGGFVTYSNAMKQHQLGVDVALLERFGAVSQEVAIAMAEGAIARSGAACAVSVTGIAGPTGGSAEKPVGLVWLAIARKNGTTRSVRRQFTGSRATVRAETVRCALSLLAES